MYRVRVRCTNEWDDWADIEYWTEIYKNFDPEWTNSPINAVVDMNDTYLYVNLKDKFTD